VNQNCLDLLKLTSDQIIGKKNSDLDITFFDKDGKTLAEENHPVNIILESGEPLRNMEIGISKKSSQEIIWTICNGYPQKNNSHIEKIIITYKDISAQKSAIPFEEIVNQANDIILVTEADPLEVPGPRIVYVNNAFTDLTGYTQREVLGRTPRILQRQETSRETRNRIKESLKRHEYVHEKILNFSKAGKQYWLDIKIIPLTNSKGTITHYAAIERDITEQVEKEQELEERSITDPLTGLLNRRGFYEYSQKLISSSMINNHTSGLAMIDIDHFKKVNDTYGHDIGDRALKVLSENLKTNFRENDIIARLGGEEFAVVLYGADSKNSFLIMDTFRKKISTKQIHVSDSESISITISAGVVAITNENHNINSLIKKADQLLYEAKKSGRNCIKN
jgi:diguanylate cyclase (GGDEF)-like protein/PAS domain S-box-containing protein